MKKFLIALLVIVGQIVTAQESQEEKKYKNEIRYVATSQILGRTQAAYERGLGNHHSVGVGFGLNIGGGIKIKEISSDNLYINGLQFKKGVFTNLEYRYYFKDTSLMQGLDGFYIGAYSNFLNREFNTNGWFLDDSNNKSYFNLDAKLNTFSVGIQAGYKLRIYKHFTMDFLILGPGYASNKLEINFNSNVNQATIDKIRSTIDERYNFLNGKLPEFKANNGEKNYEMSFGLPAFRYGIGLGYSF